MKRGIPLSGDSPLKMFHTRGGIIYGKIKMRIKVQISNSSRNIFTSHGKYRLKETRDFFNKFSNLFPQILRKLSPAISFC